MTSIMNKLDGPQESSVNGTSASVLERNVSSRSSEATIHPIPGRPTERLEIELGGDEPPENAAEDETQYPSRAIMGLTFFACALAITLVSLNTNILATAVPHITDEFGTISDVGWYSAGYRLAACAFQFMFGRMYYLWNMKYVFMSTIVIFEAGSLLCGFAPTSAALVAGRVIQGIGGGGLVAGCYCALMIIPLRYRAIFISSIAVIEGAMAAAAPLIGGVLTDASTWRWCFWMNVPVGFVVLVLLAVFLKEVNVGRDRELPLKDKIKKLDLFGTALIIPAIATLLLALQFGGTKYGWGDPRIIVCLVLSAVMLVAFGAWQVYRQDDATLPPRIIKQRTLLAGMIFNGTINGLMTVVEYYIPIYFQTVAQTSAQTSGLLLLSFIISGTLSSFCGGALISWIGYWTPPMIFTAILTPIACGLLSTLTVDATLQACIYLGLFGTAVGLGFQGPNIAAQTLLPTADVPMGIACIQFAQSFGPAIVVPAAQTLFTTQLTHDLLQGAPGVNATALENMGLSDLRLKVQASQLDGTLMGFDKALMQTMYLPTAMACTLIFASFAMEWRSCKKKNN